MKSIIALMLLISLSAMADVETEKREYTKKSSTDAEVVITVPNPEEGTQAAAFIDGAEIAQFMNDLLEDKNSEIYKVAKQIEKENCDEEEEREYCGEATITGHVRTSFARDGWMGGGAGLTLFIGFTSHGTGRFFDSSYIVNVLEEVEAQVTEEGEFNGKIIKKLTLRSVKKIEL